MAERGHSRPQQLPNASVARICCRFARIKVAADRNVRACRHWPITVRFGFSFEFVPKGSIVNWSRIMNRCCIRACRPSFLLNGLLVSWACLGSATESPYLYGIHDHSPDPTEYLSHITNATGAGGW